jgi:hypothetical protein
MEDLICPECGRPNLGEAKKCWYCQTVLIRAENHAGAFVESEYEAHTAQDTSLDPDPIEPEPEADIPEWLANIRRKIEVEQGPQEELPYWKQKDIFGGEKQLKPKPVKEKKPPIVPDKNPQQSDQDVEEDSEPIAEEDLDHSEMDDEHLSDELPDGFIKL